MRFPKQTGRKQPQQLRPFLQGRIYRNDKEPRGMHLRAACFCRIALMQAKFVQNICCKYCFHAFDITFEYTYIEHTFIAWLDTKPICLQVVRSTWCCEDKTGFRLPVGLSKWRKCTHRPKRRWKMFWPWLILVSSITVSHKQAQYPFLGSTILVWSSPLWKCPFVEAQREMRKARVYQTSPGAPIQAAYRRVHVLFYPTSHLWVASTFKEKKNTIRHLCCGRSSLHHVFQSVAASGWTAAYLQIQY